MRRSCWQRLAQGYLLLLFCALCATQTIQPLDAANSNGNQAKRDLSLSYAATDIDSKEGTRVKTITVIKNIGNSDKLVIDPALHKSEDWGSVFRDNFESFATIPDVPDVDDLFEFVKKKDGKKQDDAKPSTTNAPAPAPAPAATEKAPTEIVKPVKEESSEEEPPAVADKSSDAVDKVDKIKGDAELIAKVVKSTNDTGISGGGSGSGSMLSSGLRSQSLRRNRARESYISFNYTMLNKPAQQQQHSEKYVQENYNGYDYPPPQPQPQSLAPQKPCAPNVVTATTPSGRTYDITLDNNKNNGAGNPYIAPAIAKKTFVQQQQVTPPLPAATSPPTYISVNSILPPLQQPGVQAFNYPPNNINVNVNANSNPNANANINNNNIQRPAQTVPKHVYSTSQKPYVAPNVVNGIVTAKPLYAKPSFPDAPKHLRTNIFGAAANRPNTARSRGLKY